MKKVFTFVAAMFAAVCVNAQDVITFDAGTTYKDLDILTVGSLTLQLGKDEKKAAAWDNKAYTIKDGGANVAPFGTTVQYVSGGDNPKDEAGGTYKPDGKNLPEKGTYYMITPAKDGSVTVGIILNASKTFYVAKKSDGSAFLPSELTLQDVAGADVELGEDYRVTEKFYGTVAFPAVANETYYLFCLGSKLGCFGAYLTSNTSTGVSSVVLGNDVEAAKVNLAGQRVGNAYKGIVIQNGRKMIQK